MKNAQPVQRKRQQRGERRMETILDVSSRLFGERGVEGVSMNALAKETGLSIGSLYQYFPSKSAVVAALAQSYTRTYDSEVAEHWARHGASMGSLRDVIAAGVFHNIEFAVRHLGTRALLFADPRTVLSSRDKYFEDCVAIMARFFPNAQPKEMIAMAELTRLILVPAAAAISGEPKETRDVLGQGIVDAIYYTLIGRLGSPMEPE